MTHAIASLGVTVAKLGDSKKEPQLEWFDPIPLIARRKEALKTVPRQAAKVFMELMKSQGLPSWVLASVDVEAIELVVKNG